MASIQFYTRFKDSRHVDDLCPFCFNPALVEYTLQKLDLDGITILGTRVACRDCKKWTEPLQATPLPPKPPMKEITQ